MINDNFRGFKDSWNRVTINFVSNNTTYTSFYYYDTDRSQEIPFVPGDTIIAYGDDRVYLYENGWTNQAYRTVTFETPPTGSLLTWLQANAVKQ